MIACVNCSTPLPPNLAATVEVVEGTCPSGCDAAAIISIVCPACGQTAWNKAILASYATQHEWPEWVKISPFRLTRNDLDQAEYSLLPGDGETVELYVGTSEGWRHLATLSSTPPAGS